MSEILGKFYTLDWSVWHHHSKELMGYEYMRNFWDFQKKSEYKFADFKLPNGRPFTKKDLVNYEDYI